jgi:hypothetical protein
VFHYEGTGDNDEASYRFGAHAFKLGEYVSIQDHHDEIHTFKVASVLYQNFINALSRELARDAAIAAAVSA